MNRSPSELYQERQKRVADAVALQPTDRVPFTPFTHFFPRKYVNISFKSMMYDYNRLAEAWKTYLQDIQPDAFNHPYPITALGPLMDITAAVTYKWPGGDLEENRPYQFVEGEYMTADEYDDFLFDPTDFMLRIYLPRVYKALAPMSDLPYWPSAYYTRFLSALAALMAPQIHHAFQTMNNAAEEARSMMNRGSRFIGEMEEIGFPQQFGGIAYAPFDYLGDLFRGTRGIYLDIYRCPDKLFAAMDKALKIVVRGAAAGCRQTGNPYVFIPLHKGNDRMMSAEMFNNFYWPTLKQMILQLIDLEMVPVVFWESECTSRIETIADIPGGKAVYWFESTDIFRAKDVLSGHICIRGNVPASILCMGTPDEVKTYCEKLIKLVGRGGGFILDGGVGIPDETPIENARAMAAAVREYSR